MIKPEHAKRAKEIGNDSWELINFTQLPKSASKKRQVEALKMDARWQEDHVNNIVRQIDSLCNEIEYEETP